MLCLLKNDPQVYPALTDLAPISHPKVWRSRAYGIGNAVVALIFSIAKREVTFLSGTAAIRRL